MAKNHEADTVELMLPGAEREAPAPKLQIAVEIAALSHAGHVRPRNEDHYLVARVHRGFETMMTNLPRDDVPVLAEDVGYGMVVADGMGGAAGGDVASRLAIGTLVSLCLDTPDWIMRPGPQAADAIMRRMASRYRQVDTALRERGEENPALVGMGSTMTLATSLQDILMLVHLGDSRAYLLRKHALHQLTCDHTLVQGLVDHGIIKEEQAATHNLRHLLTRVLGGGSGRAEADVRSLRLQDADQLLLCTDGLTKMVDEQRIRDILAQKTSADAACQALVHETLGNGGKDNVTVIVARYRARNDSTQVERA